VCNGPEEEPYEIDGQELIKKHPERVVEYFEKYMHIRKK